MQKAVTETVKLSKVDKILINLGTNNSSQIATAVLAGFKMIFLPIATATDKTASPDQKKYTMIRDIIMEGLALITYIGVTGQIQKHASAPIAAAYFKHKAKMLKLGKIKPATNISKEDMENVIKELESVDSKKIKEAGEDFLTQISQNHKKMSSTTKTYIEKLDNIVDRLNGKTNERIFNSLQECTDHVNGKVINEEGIAVNKGRQLNEKSDLIFNDMKKAAKESASVLKPLKVFQNTRIALSQLSVWILALIVIPPMCNAIIAPIMKEVNKRLNNKKPADNNTIHMVSFTPINNTNGKKSFSKFYNYFPENRTGMRV